MLVLNMCFALDIARDCVATQQACVQLVGYSRARSVAGVRGKVPNRRSRRSKRRSEYLPVQWEESRDPMLPKPLELAHRIFVARFRWRSRKFGEPGLSSLVRLATIRAQSYRRSHEGCYPGQIRVDLGGAMQGGRGDFKSADHSGLSLHVDGLPTYQFRSFRAASTNGIFRFSYVVTKNNDNTSREPPQRQRGQ